MAKDGSYYWVFTHVTPTFDSSGKIIGYQSDRRPVRNREFLNNVIIPLYQELKKEEQKGLDAGMRKLEETLNKIGMSYEEFIFKNY